MEITKQEWMAVFKMLADGHDYNDVINTFGLTPADFAGLRAIIDKIGGSDEILGNS